MLHASLAEINCTAIDSVYQDAFLTLATLVTPISVPVIPVDYGLALLAMESN